MDRSPLVDAETHARGASVVLCGGESRRMGRPKAWLPFGPETLLQRSVRLFAPRVCRVVVSAAPDQALPPLPPEVEVARDSSPGGGPLHGLAASLDLLSHSALTSPPLEWFYWTGCDYPWTSPELLRLLGETLRADESLESVVPEVDGFLQPLCAIYRPRIAAPLAGFLQSGGSSVLEFLGRLRLKTLSAAVCEAAGVSPEAFHNLNTPDAYQTALSRLAAEAP